MTAPTTTCESHRTRTRQLSASRNDNTQRTAVVRARSSKTLMCSGRRQRDDTIVRQSDAATSAAESAPVTTCGAASCCSGAATTPIPSDDASVATTRSNQLTEVSTNINGANFITSSSSRAAERHSVNVRPFAHSMKRYTALNTDSAGRHAIAAHVHRPTT